MHSTATSSDNKFSSSAAKLHHTAQLFATHHHPIASFNNSKSIQNYLANTSNNSVGPNATIPQSPSSGKLISKAIRILPHPTDPSSSSSSPHTAKSEGGQHHQLSIASSPATVSSKSQDAKSSSFVPVAPSSTGFTPLSSATHPSLKQTKMASPRNQKRDIHAPDFAYEVKFPVQPVPDNIVIPAEQKPLMPNPETAIAMKKYATSVDDRNFLTVYEYMVNNQWVIWDYYTGYVHLTGLWKAIGNNKADIVKLVENSPDLEPVIRRVRGGFLKIQGTWLPFPIAKALASRTCYHIRYALVPIFGASFPESCLQPHEPGFGQLQLHVSATPKRRRKRAMLAAPPSNRTSPQLSSHCQPSNPPPQPDLIDVDLDAVTGSAEPLPRKRTKSDSVKPKPSNTLKRQYHLHQLAASPAASAVASPPLAHLSTSASGSPSLQRTFYASPQAVPLTNFNSDQHDSVSSDAACYSDDDEPLLMTASASSNASMIAAASARSRRASSTYHAYRSRRHSSRLFSASSTPTSSLPSSPTLINQSYHSLHTQNHHYQQHSLVEPVTPPPMPVKLSLPDADATLADSPSEFVQVLQATRSLQQMSMSAAAAAAGKSSSQPMSLPRFSFDPKSLGGGFEFAGKLWSWDGHEKLNIVGSAKDAPRVILPPPGSAPTKRPPTPPSAMRNVMDINGLIS